MQFVNPVKPSQDFSKPIWPPITCVSAFLEIHQSLQCKIFQYTFFGQYPIKFWDFLSLCKIKQPAWLQLDHKKLRPSEMRFSDDPYMMKLKNALSCEIYSFEKLWLANLWNSKPIKMDKKIKLVFTNCSNLCQRWDRKSITWNMCWGPPSSGGIWKQLRRRKQIERVGLLQSKGKWSNWLPFEKFLFPHIFDTQMHL